MVLYRLRIVCQLLINLFLSGYILIIGLSCNLSNPNSDTLPYFNSQDLTPTWNSDKPHHIANFNLIDQNGNVFNSDSLKGKIYIANFFFTTCPSICPKMTNTFKILQDSISKIANVELVSFSVMPWVDSAEKLQSYGNKNGINTHKWHLLTGEKSVIYNLGRASFFADKSNVKDSTTFLHTDKMYLIDGKKYIRGVYNATNMEDIGRVLADMKILEKES